MKKTPKRAFPPVVIGAFLAIFSASAPAQLIITNQTNSFDVFATNAPGAAGYYFSFDTLTKDFDKWSGPESLISVEITFMGRNTGSFFVGASPAATVTAVNSQQNFSFVGGGGPTSIFDASPYDLTTSPGPLPQSSSVGMFSLPTGGSTNAWQLNGTYTYTDPTLLASYFTGAGKFQMRLNNLLQIFASSGTPIGSGLISTGDVTVTMTAIPEPSTLSLALVGALFGWTVLKRPRSS